EGDLDEDGLPVVVLAKKRAFRKEEEEAFENHLNGYPELVALYQPSDPGAIHSSALFATTNPSNFARHIAYNVAPVNDNAPFFFFTLKLGQILRPESIQQGIDWKVNLGVAVLGMVLIISVVAVLAFLVMPLAKRQRRHKRSVRLLYFVAVGL